MKRTRFTALIALSISLALFNGCLFGDDDSGDNPVGENGGFGENADLLPIEDDIADGVTNSAIGLTLDMLSAMIEWSETPPGSGALRAETTNWSAEDSAWIIAGSEEEQSEEVTATLEFTYWLQYRADGVPQQEATELTDEIEIRADIGWAGTYTPGEGGYSVTFDWIADYDVTGTRNPDETVSLVGAGSIDGESTTTWQDNTYDHEQNVTWSHDLDAAPGEACASGQITGSFSRYGFSAVLDGAGNVATTLMRDGEVIDTGTDEYSCDGGGSGEL